MYEFSTLAKTWILDVDGTIVKHNGHLIDGYDTLLDGVKDFFDKIPPEDKIIILTGRKKEDMKKLKQFLKKHDIRYDFLIPEMPTGERILINDIKPNGLKMAFSYNKGRDEKLEMDYKINKDLKYETERHILR